MMCHFLYMLDNATWILFMTPKSLHLNESTVNYKPLEMTNVLDLGHLFGPWSLCPRETRVVVVGLPESAEKLLAEGVLLPGFHSFPILLHQWLWNERMEGGKTLGGGEKTLPRLHKRAIKRPWGRKKGDVTQQGAQRWLMERRERQSQRERKNNLHLSAGKAQLKTLNRSWLDWKVTVCYVSIPHASRPYIRTFVHDGLPLAAPLAELLSVFLLHSGPFGKAGHDVIGGLVGLLCSLHRPHVIPRLTYW